MSTLAQAIAQMEGFNTAGTLAQRNNNPGNLRSSPLATGTSGGFAVFPDIATGWQALDAQIALDASRGLTLEQFINKYAPPSENNTGQYLSYLVTQTGMQPSDLLLGAIDPSVATSSVDIPSLDLTTITVVAGLAVAIIAWAFID
jgi:hypothetical protein